MKQLGISKFMRSCNSVVAEVQRTGKPVLITRFGKPLVKLVPAKPRRADSWLGSMREEMEIFGDIVGPIGAFEFRD
jgi:prevent-host-death family protein